MGVANPTALLLATSMLLDHATLHSFADRIEKAVKTVIKKGECLTPDMGGSAGTMDFADAVAKEC